MLAVESMLKIPLFLHSAVSGLRRKINMKATGSAEFTPIGPDPRETTAWKVLNKSLQNDLPLPEAGRQERA